MNFHSSEGTQVQKSSNFFVYIAMQPRASTVQYLCHIEVTPCLARGGYDLSIFGAKVTQDFPGGAGDLKILVPKSWYQDLGTRILVPKSWYQDLGTKILVSRSWFQNLKVRSWLLAPPTTLAFYGLNVVSP